ncbi:MAG TPA: ABC transporter ATP-binding protein [Thiolinea sp.]|nr:ABC transporter ATP-binding protein [Thiolinea sp.]
MKLGSITLQQAGVSYRQYARPHDALLEWLLRRPRHRNFHALKGISLTLEPGASLGLVGDNGAGKSTLLRLLAGNLVPTEGRCDIYGHRAALLELGSGLHPEYTGLENARLGLALRGLEPAAVEQVLPEVLAFAGLGDFIHRPLKQYSSGMVVRLGFSIAIQANPDVLIVDEALSVGDQFFQKRSLDRMRHILNQGATLIFCSHNLYQVREMCTQAVWLEQGQIRLTGTAQAVVDAYQDSTRARTADMPATITGSPTPATPATPQMPRLLAVTLAGDQQAAETETEVSDHQQSGLPAYRTHAAFAVEVTAHTAGMALEDLHVGIVLRRNDDVQCFGISTLHDGFRLEAGADGNARVCFTIERLPLLSGHYCLEVWLIDASGVHVYDARERCCPFQVRQDSQQQGIGLCWMPHQWQNRGLAT